jgi:hypothetical protein
MLLMPRRPHTDTFRPRILQQLGVELPTPCTLLEPQPIPVPVLRVVIDGAISHQIVWSQPIQERDSSEGPAGGPVIMAYPGRGAVRMRNIRPTFQTLLKGCEQLPARAVRAGSDTTGTAGTIQRGALCMLVVYATTTPTRPGPPLQQQPVGSLLADVDHLLHSLQQGDASYAAAVQGPSMRVPAGKGVPLIAASAPAETSTAAPRLPATKPLGDQEVEVDDVSPADPDWVPSTATGTSSQGPLGCSTGTGTPSLYGASTGEDVIAGLAPATVQGHTARLEDHRCSQLLQQPEAQQGMTMTTCSAGQASMAWPTLGRPAQRAALPPLLDSTLPPVGEECRLPADFSQSYGIRSTKVLRTRQAPAWWVLLQ